MLFFTKIKPTALSHEKPPDVGGLRERGVLAKIKSICIAFGVGDSAVFLASPVCGAVRVYSEVMEMLFASVTVAHF